MVSKTLLPIAVKSHCGSFAPVANWALNRSPFIPLLMTKPCMCGLLMKAYVLARLAAKSYLSIPAIVAACEITGADAVHPGYGFLSENAKFVDILDEHNISFIGPTAEHIRVMGDKIAAKAKAIELGIPVVPGSDGEVKNVDDAIVLGRDMGFPVLVKAASGGGGRGMKIAHSENDLAEAFTTARAEAKAAFGDDAVYIEKYLEKPRHIEIQVACDTHGNAVHLGERDCSLQRRHQKVLEEAPSTVLTTKRAPPSAKSLPMP